MIDWSALAYELSQNPAQRASKIEALLAHSEGSVERALAAFLATCSAEDLTLGLTHLVQRALSLPEENLLHKETKDWCSQQRFEKPLLYQKNPLVPACQLLIEAHHGAVRDLIYDAGGERAFSLGEAQELCAFDLTSGRRLWKSALSSERYLIARPSAKECIAWAERGQISVFRYQDGGRRLSLSSAQGCRFVVLSLDESELYALSYTGVLHCWDVTSGELRASFSLPGAEIAAALALMGALLIARVDGQVEQISPKDGAVLSRWSWPSPQAAFRLLSLEPLDTPDAVRAIAEQEEWVTSDITSPPEPTMVRFCRTLHLKEGWSSNDAPAGDTPLCRWGALALYAAGASLELYEAQKKTAAFFGHEALITRALFLSEKKALSAAEDGCLRLWDLSAEEGRQRRLEADIHELMLLQDGAHVVAKTHRLWGIWSAEGGAVEPWDIGRSVVMHPERRLISAVRHTSPYSVIDVFSLGQRGSRHESWRHFGNQYSAALSEDGRSAITRGTRHRLYLFALESGAFLFYLDGHTDSISRLIVHPDGERLISASQDRTVRLWDIKSGAQLASYRVSGSGLVMDMSLLADGLHVMVDLSGSHEIVSLQSGACIGFPGPKALATQPRTDTMYLSYSPDGSLRASMEHPGKLIAFENETNQPLPLSISSTWNEYTRPLFLHDNSLLLSDGAAIHRWNLRTGERLGSYLGHTASMLRLALHPDKKRFLSASKDQSIRVWDIDSGACLLVLPGFSSNISELRVMPSGELFVSGGAPAESRFFALEGGALLRSQKPCITLSPDAKIGVSSYHPDTLIELSLNIPLDPKAARYTEQISGILRLHAYFSDTRQVVFDGGRPPCFVLELSRGDRHSFDLGLLPDARERRHCNDPLVSLDPKERLLRLTSRSDWKTRRIVLPEREAAPRLLRVEKAARYAVLCLSAETSTLLSLQDGALLGVCQGHRDAIIDQDISSDGARLLTVSEDMTARLWSLPDCKPLAVWYLSAMPRGCVITEDQRLAIADKTGVVFFLSCFSGWCPVS